MHISLGVIVVALASGAVARPQGFSPGGEEAPKVETPADQLTQSSGNSQPAQVNGYGYRNDFEGSWENANAEAWKQSEESIPAHPSFALPTGEPRLSSFSYNPNLPQPTNFPSAGSHLSSLLAKPSSSLPTNYPQLSSFLGELSSRAANPMDVPVPTSAISGIYSYLQQPSFSAPPQLSSILAHFSSHLANPTALPSISATGRAKLSSIFSEFSSQATEPITTYSIPGVPSSPLSTGVFSMLSGGSSEIVKPTKTTSFPDFSKLASVLGEIFPTGHPELSSIIGHISSHAANPTNVAPSGFTSSSVLEQTATSLPAEETKLSSVLSEIKSKYGEPANIPSLSTKPGFSSIMKESSASVPTQIPQVSSILTSTSSQELSSRSLPLTLFTNAPTISEPLTGLVFRPTGPFSFFSSLFRGSSIQTSTELPAFSADDPDEIECWRKFDFSSVVYHRQREAANQYRDGTCQGIKTIHPKRTASCPIIRRPSISTLIIDSHRKVTRHFITATHLAIRIPIRGPEISHLGP